MEDKRVEKLVGEIRSMIGKETYQDWEDSGHSCFDPFGIFDEWLTKRLTEELSGNGER